jgi:hypothetical protein
MTMEHLIREADFDGVDPLPNKRSLMASEKVPKYYDSHEGIPCLLIFDLHLVSMVCDFTVDLRVIARDEFSVGEGPEGKYYSIQYQIGITFGPEILFKLMFKGRELGKAITKYIR